MLRPLETPSWTKCRNSPQKPANFSTLAAFPTLKHFWHYSNAIGGVRLAVEDIDIEDASTAYQEYMAALREGPYPEEPVRIWPAVALLSLCFGLPLLLLGRHRKGTTPPE
jgi:hypothetical protein